MMVGSSGVALTVTTVVSYRPPRRVVSSASLYEGKERGKEEEVEEKEE